MYSAQEMYDLVSDIESYPEFLPGCVGGNIIKQDGEWAEATLELAKGGLRHSFSTRNRMVSGQMIEMHLLEGPFRQLFGVWTFQALSEKGCKVSLELDFEMSNTLAQMTVGAVFEKMINKMVEAFADRAKQVYGQ